MLVLLTANGFAQDWANKAKYAADNARLANTDATNRIVLMGDSITEFWTKRDPDFFEDKPYLINRGIGGQTTPQMLERFEQDVIALKPKVVVILAGTNDIAGNTGPISLDDIMGNLSKMAQLAQKHQIKVVMCALLPAAAYGWNPDVDPIEKIVALNKMIKAYADANGTGYVDYYSATVDENNGLMKAFSGDGVHPNKKGYKVMAPLLEAAILKIPD